MRPQVAFHPDKPQRLFAQNHFGVYRSEDRGDSWTPIESGLPSNFGFALVAHPHRPETLYSFPLQADAERFPRRRKLRVYRTEDAGANWEPISKGLPADPYYAAVLRDAMVADRGDPAGVYFGTRLGEVYASRDDGDSWSLIASTCPTSSRCESPRSRDLAVLLPAALRRYAGEEAESRSAVAPSVRRSMTWPCGSHNLNAPARRAGTAAASRAHVRQRGERGEAGRPWRHPSATVARCRRPAVSGGRS